MLEIIIMCFIYFKINPMISTLRKYIGEGIVRQARRLIGCFLILLLAHLRSLMLDLLSQQTPSRSFFLTSRLYAP